MNVFSWFSERLDTCLGEIASAEGLDFGPARGRVAVEPPREAAFGDISTNAAMVLAKPSGMKPRDLAARLAAMLAEWPEVAAADIAGPGFVNVRLHDDFWRARIGDILAAGTAYGRSNVGRGVRVNVEYVSANPTGPLHVGHARGAVVGDALAGMLQAAGYEVTREYYINDAGAQVDALARSAHLRYREALGEAIGEIPAGLYPADYLRPVGEALAARDGDRWISADEEDWLPDFREFTVDAMMALVREDLAALGIAHDVFTSERALVAAGRVDEALAALERDGLVYTGVLEPPKGRQPDDWEPRPQTLFAATRFGDDVDRPLKKSDGSWTYFASDIAYHRDKFVRGFAELIDVWGADHGGYVKRMVAATRAITGAGARLDVKICQIVRLLDNGEAVRMSKRAGDFVTLRDLVDEVGKDVVRFIMLTRSNDAQLDFDLAKAKEQSRDNPVFYVQYAHARCNSVRRMAEKAFPDLALDNDALAAVDLAPLAHDAEVALIRMLAAWPRTLEAAALAHEPHRIAYYLYDLAAAFHALWTRGKDETELRLVIEGDRETTQARLALARAVQCVVASGLGVFGVEPVEELR